MNLFDILIGYLPWLRYRRTGRPPAQAVQPGDIMADDVPDDLDWLRPCPFCGRSAETNGIAVWCPTLTHGLMTRDDWQGRV